MVSVVRESKFRHVFGEELPQKFTDVKPNHLNSDGPMLCSNGKSLAMSWVSGNAGILGVFRMSETGRVSEEERLIKGHTAPLTDFKFNPFHEQQLLSASNDCTIKLWDLPEEGSFSEIQDARVTLLGHTKKVTLLDFHPTAAWLVASTALDRSIKVWNLESGVEASEYANLPENAFSLAWSPHGRLMGFTGKDKHFRALDLRSPSEVFHIPIHSGAKPTKLCWLNEDTVLTTGFSKTADRQFGLWDVRNPTEAIKLINADQGTGVVFPYYDADTKLLFTCGRGDGSIRFYERVDDAQGLYYISNYNSPTPSKGFDFIPKRKVDANSCEIMRCVRLTNNAISQVSFKVPRRAGTFQPDLFPPCLSGKPALGPDEWLSGQDAEPLRSDFHEAATGTTVMKVAKTSQEYERELSAAYARIKELEARVAELEALN